MTHTWAFDIETLGQLPFKLDVKPPPITCVCLYDGSREIEHALSFYGVEPSIFEANRTLLLDLLDSARTLVGYNAVRFDLPYIQRFFELSPERLARWIAKTVDPYLFMRDTLGITCGLGAMLALNRHRTKSASGLIAILWARQGHMDRVLEYCMLDTKLTYALCGTPAQPFLLTDRWAAQWRALPDDRIAWQPERRPPPAPPSLVPCFLPTERLVREGLILWGDNHNKATA